LVVWFHDLTTDYLEPERCAFLRFPTLVVNEIGGIRCWTSAAPKRLRLTRNGAASARAPIFLPSIDDERAEQTVDRARRNTRSRVEQWRRGGVLAAV